uniref:Fibronectin type-III domain-containing protein n=1 Tax=Schistocephalus solidus TaxID=70667 RepID=A0A0X3PFR9_SCHSO
MDMNCLAFVCYFGSLFLSVASASASDTKFQVLQNESTTFYVRWSSTFSPNESAVFCVTVGQMFYAECRKPLGKGNFFCKIGDRLPNTQYLLQLWICPSSSESTDTCQNVSNTVTAYTTPQAPTTANAAARNNETIEVMWQNPTQNLNDLMTLIVLYGGDSPQTIMQTTDSRPQSVKFTNLTALRAYNATLVIYNINNNYKSSTVYTRTVLTLPNGKFAHFFQHF